jgi:hypothetical protein
MNWSKLIYTLRLFVYLAALGVIVWVGSISSASTPTRILMAVVWLITAASAYLYLGKREAEWVWLRLPLIMFPRNDCEKQALRGATEVLVVIGRVVDDFAQACKVEEWWQSQVNLLPSFVVSNERDLRYMRRRERYVKLGLAMAQEHKEKAKKKKDQVLKQLKEFGVLKDNFNAAAAVNDAKAEYHPEKELQVALESHLYPKLAKQHHAA